MTHPRVGGDELNAPAQVGLASTSHPVARPVQLVPLAAAKSGFSDLPGACAEADAEADRLPASPSVLDVPVYPCSAASSSSVAPTALDPRKVMDSYLISALSVWNLYEAIFPIGALRRSEEGRIDPKKVLRIDLAVPPPGTKLAALPDGELYWAQLLHWRIIAANIRFMLLVLCLAISGALVSVGLWVDAANLPSYALALVLAPLVIGLCWTYITKMQWDEPIYRMMRVIQADLNRPSGELLECEELTTINATCAQLFMLLITNASIVTGSLSRPILLTAIGASPMAVWLLLSIYYIRRVEPAARAYVRLWDYYLRLQEQYSVSSFVLLQKNLLDTFEMNAKMNLLFPLHFSAMRTLAYRLHDRHKRDAVHSPGWIKVCWRVLKDSFIDVDILMPKLSEEAERKENRRLPNALKIEPSATVATTASNDTASDKV
jgi:hypothetical protein